MCIQIHDSPATFVNNISSKMTFRFIRGRVTHGRAQLERKRACKTFHYADEHMFMTLCQCNWSWGQSLKIVNRLFFLSSPLWLWAASSVRFFLTPECFPGFSCVLIYPSSAATLHICDFSVRKPFTLRGVTFLFVKYYKWLLHAQPQLVLTVVVIVTSSMVRRNLNWNCFSADFRRI